MRFTYNGNEFRICFRHDKSILLADHIGHSVQIMRGSRITDGGSEVDFRVVLYCVSCRCLVGTVPKIIRKRTTRCSVQFLQYPAETVNGEHIREVWKRLVHGTGTPNTKAGDRFNKEDGRKFSLSNALASRPAEGVSLAGTTFPLGTALSEDFKEAVLQAYYARKPIKAVTYVG